MESVPEIEFICSDITDHFESYTGNTNGMWVVENQDFKKGGFVEWKTPYRLKHFTTGMYLCVK